ncbi:12809_t:CDS:2 [Dentiscutata heterogama]|uniref:12809_t:CDS:1 n=1 Tax=Dentiscutata heterogama TaxID=1316150 RepID=A0ACA9JXU7_9GLOM|nr:12809_t:CDS:2 [Dentiscutata heterogama]
MFKLSEPLNTDNTESFENRPKKIYKVEQSVYNSVTENANEIDKISSQESYDLASHLLHESQEQPEKLNELCLNEDNRQISLDQSLKAPSDKSAGEVKCDVVMLVDGNENRCDKVFSITTLTTHLEEHLNATWWNSTYFILKRLVQLRDTVEQLAKSLSHYSEQQQRKDGQNLSEKLLSKSEWNELDELILLLSPFAQSTKLIRGSQYPTLGMMLLTISLLSSHLHCIKISLTSSKILNVCQLIEDSISACYDLPLTEAYVAFYLDP